MIEVRIKCDLCPQEVVVEARVGHKIDLPRGWVSRTTPDEVRKFYAGRPWYWQFCSSEHSHAYSEAETAASEEAMGTAKDDFAKRLRLKCQAAISVVDALATLAPEDPGDRNK